MPPLRDLSDAELNALLERAREQGASGSVRPVGSGRILGDLHILALEPGVALTLGGGNAREKVPPVGTRMVMSLVGAEEVMTLSATVLKVDPLDPVEPFLRLSWPERRVVTQPRNLLRVAAPDLPPMQAELFWGSACWEAALLRLSESGAGLAMASLPPGGLMDSPIMRTLLPGGFAFQAAGELIALDHLENDPLPERMELVFTRVGDDERETLARFIQARRSERSNLFRGEH